MYTFHLRLEMQDNIGLKGKTSVINLTYDRGIRIVNYISGHYPMIFMVTISYDIALDNKLHMRNNGLLPNTDKYI